MANLMNERKRISRENQEMFLQKRSGERIVFLTKRKKKRRQVCEQRRRKKKKKKGKGLDMAINNTTQIK